MQNLVSHARIDQPFGSSITDLFHFNEDLLPTTAMWRVRVVCCTLSVLSLSCGGDIKAKTCSDVRQAFAAKGFTLVNVPHQEMSGKEGEYKPGEFSFLFTQLHW